MAKVEISKEIEMDVGHRVPHHKMACRRLHGHRYRVRVHLEGAVVEEEGASDQGMLADFGDLKKSMTELIHDPYDHHLVLWAQDPLVQLFTESDDSVLEESLVVVDFIPAAENWAIFIWDVMKDGLQSQNWYRGNFRLSQVDVWETPTSLAVHRGSE